MKDQFKAEAAFLKKNFITKEILPRKDVFNLRQGENYLLYEDGVLNRKSSIILDKDIIKVEGSNIQIKKGKTKVVNLFHLFSTDVKAVDCFLKLHLEKDAFLLMNVEAFSLSRFGVFFSHFLEVEADENSQLEINNFLDVNEGYCLDGLALDLQRNAKAFFYFFHYKTLFMIKKYLARLLGENGKVDFKGGCALSGVKGKLDLKVEHLSSATVSSQDFRSVVSRHGEICFNSESLISKGAFACESFQLSKSLLLDPTSKAVSSPVLKVFSSDAIARHGATTSGISAEDIFYLRTRGIPCFDARRLYLAGFYKDILNSELFKKKIDASLDGI